jgi:hypothetical protein
VNTIERVYFLYNLKNIKAIEIDVQPTKDGQIVVYHDDVSSLSYDELSPYVPTFEQFLRFIPQDVCVNVEVKKYDKSASISKEVLALCEKYPRDYVYSSFDKDTYDDFVRSEKKCWHLQDKMVKYDPTVPNICIHKSMLPDITTQNHQSVTVYDVLDGSVDEMQSIYPFVTVWIADYE